MNQQPLFAAATALTALAGAVALPACAQRLDAPPYRAEVLDLVGFDRDTEEAHFELAVQELTELDDFDRLEGDWLRVRRGGVLEIRQVAGEVIQDGRFYGGADPGLRYHVEGDVAVARDYPTLVMLSSYYNFERVFEAIERITGTPTDQFIDRVGRYEILFEPVFRVSGGQADATAELKFNAFYLFGAHQFGLARRSSIEKVPLAANILVLAHEFGHALFEQTFFGGDNPECAAGAGAEPSLPGRLGVEYAISGLNEGFGDFTSFAITGSTNPLAGYDFVGDERSLVRSDYRFGQLRGPVDPAVDPVCAGGFYCIGTLFARSLYQAFTDLGFDPDSADDRGVFAREVVAAVTMTFDTMRARDELPAPDAAAAACEERDFIDLDYDGKVTGAFLGAFVANLSPETRAAFCAAAVQNFGERGFPDSGDACGGTP